MEGETVPVLLASSGLIIALTALGLVAVQFVGRRVLTWTRSQERVGDARRQQLVTLIQVTRWLLNILLIGAAAMMLLSTFGIDITPLLASAGVAGLAVSLGAQTVIKDLIGGVLVLVENQYAVGDLIEVGGVSGQVERITLRTTHVRDINGNLNVIPNGEVRIVANQTRDWSRALVEVGVAYEEDLERAMAVLRESAEGFALEPEYEASLLEPPQVVGPVSLGDSAAIVRVMVKTQPGKHLEIGRELRRRLLDACDREGVSLPYPRQEIWVRGLQQELSGTASD